MATSQLASPPSTTSPPTRRPYHGSCHCGLTKYIVYLTLPPLHPVAHPPGGYPSTVSIRKCNCTTCHKTSFFHVRTQYAPTDFVLLSPTNLFEGGLVDYTCFDKDIHWPFCGTCGVRCFGFRGEGEVVDIQLEGEGETRRVWRLKERQVVKGGKWEGEKAWTEGEGCYLSVNGVTVEAGQEGWDMREWSEKGWIAYLNVGGDVEAPRMGRPYEGGMY